MPRQPARSTVGGLRRSNRLAAKRGGASASTLASASPRSLSPLLSGSGHAGPRTPAPLLQTHSPGGEQAHFEPSRGSRPTNSPIRAESPESQTQSLSPESRPPNSPMRAESPESQIQSQSHELTRLKRVNVLLNQLLSAKDNNHAALSRIDAKRTELMVAKLKLSEANKMLQTKEEETIVKDLNSRIKRAESVVDQLRKEHKRLNEKLLDLKGTVRVFLRLCPLKESKREKEKAEDQVFKIDDKNPCIVQIREKSLTKKEINFDHVFGPKASQDVIFEEIRPLVESAVGGKKFSAVEDYNNKLKDLLSSASCALEPIVRRDKHDLPFISDLTRNLVTSTEGFSDLLKEILFRRSTGATKMNSTSSRSHCMFMFEICDEYNKDIGEITIIDLVGSDSLKETEATGLRKIEAGHISKSLSLLRTILRVIASKKKDHIRFREMNFTKILEIFLSGGTKVVMIATVSLEATSARHTVSTLQFTETVKKCNLLEVTSPVSRYRSNKLAAKDPELHLPEEPSIGVKSKSKK